ATPATRAAHAPQRGAARCGGAGALVAGAAGQSRPALCPAAGGRHLPLGLPPARQSGPARAFRGHPHGRALLARRAWPLSLGLPGRRRARWAGHATLGAAALAQLGLPALLEASRRGGHLWLLFGDPLPAQLPATSSRRCSMAWS